MKTIVVLTPCLMLENNRAANIKCMKDNLSYLIYDEYTVFAQEFNEGDKIDGINYIGNCERQGFVKTRNELLKYFYNSDFDYAYWIDANSTVSGPTRNDVITLLNAIKNEELDIDACVSTLGIIVNSDRMKLKSDPKYFEEVTLLPHASTSYWMHGMVMKNFKKYYNEELYIDEECDPKLLLPEDVFMTKLIERYFSIYSCPTITMNKAGYRTSTQVADKGGYIYPGNNYAGIAKLCDKHLHKDHKSYDCGVIKLPRKYDPYRDQLRPYIPRGKKKDEVVNNRVELF